MATKKPTENRLEAKANQLAILQLTLYQPGSEENNPAYMFFRVGGISGRRPGPGRDEGTARLMPRVLSCVHHDLSVYFHLFNLSIRLYSASVRMALRRHFSFSLVRSPVTHYAKFTRGPLPLCNSSVYKCFLPFSQRE